LSIYEKGRHNMEQNKREQFAAQLKAGAPIDQIVGLMTSVDGPLCRPEPNSRFGVKLPRLHVGSGSRFGKLDWFPVFTEEPVAKRNYVTKIDENLVKVAEHAAATVNSVAIENRGNLPLVVFEGTLLEAGWQHRSVIRTTMINANAESELPVVCVEQGRWGGDGTQKIGRRQAPAKVRAAIRGLDRGNGKVSQNHASQNLVWDEVSKYAHDHNQHAETGSFLEVRDGFEGKIKKHSRTKVEMPKPIYGMRGVIIAIGGHPVAVELFDHPETMKERFQSILEAYQVDAENIEYERTPGYRARAFAKRLESSTLDNPIDVTHFRNSPDELVASEALVEGDHIYHLAALNVKHQLVLAA